jgi:serine/threonine protein kinase
MKKEVTASRLRSSLASARVDINGGTRCYQAPELFTRNAKFSRRADVFAAGVVFLELLTLQKPNKLFDDLYPGILEVKLPRGLIKCLACSLDPDPDKRVQFTELLTLLKSGEGFAIALMELDMNAGLRFDDVAADIRLMMPSSRYDYSGNGSASSGANQESYSGSLSSIESAAATRRR